MTAKPVSDPLVSVRMITYNHESYIARAIQGVLRQKTDFDYELVIGEDCSTDATRQIVFEYQEKYPKIIRVITSEENVGIKKNGERTYQACRGKYIAWCDGDDFWHREDKLQKQVDVIEAHPECGLVCSDYDMHNQTTGSVTRRLLHSTGKHNTHPNIEDILYHRSQIHTVTVLARTPLVKEIRAADRYLYQNEKFKMGDTQLWAELSVHSKVYYIDESLATYNLLEESAANSSDEIKTLSFWKSYSEMVMYLCGKHNLSEEIYEIERREWQDKTLKLAFLLGSPDLTAEVEEKCRPSSMKTLAWYIGVKYRPLRPVIHFMRWTYSLFKPSKPKANGT